VSMSGLTGIPTWDSDGRALVVIETPRESRNKFKFDPSLGSFRLVKVLPAGMEFPFDFGYLAGTRAQDGDPLDVLVLMDAPVPVGCLVRCRLIGVIEAEEQKTSGGSWVRNDRLIAVADESDAQRHIRTLARLDPGLLSEIEAFFTTYNEIAGHGFRCLGRRGPQRARSLAHQAQGAHA
jgi:inorganic pyrophosphatase